MASSNAEVWQRYYQQPESAILLFSFKIHKRRFCCNAGNKTSCKLNTGRLLAFFANILYTNQLLYEGKTVSDGRPLHSRERHLAVIGKKAASQDKRQQFEALAYPHMDALYRTALRLTRNPLDAEDLVQEVYLRGFRFLEKFEQGTNFKAWIFRILTNTFINEYRKKARTPQHVEFEERTENVASEAAAEQRFTAPNELQDHTQLFGDEVNAALQTLSEDFRLVIILCDIEEFAYKEIAKILGIPMGTVMSRLSRARAQLQKQLREYAEQEGFIKRTK